MVCEGGEVGLMCVGLSHLLFPCLTPPAFLIPPTPCRCEREVVTVVIVHLGW
jgi:hypothetical protein